MTYTFSSHSPATIVKVKADDEKSAREKTMYEIWGKPIPDVFMNKGDCYWNK